MTSSYLQPLLTLTLLIAPLSCIPTSENDLVEPSLPDLSAFGRSVFGKPSDESGKKLSEWSEDSQVNPEELGDYLEGDILFPMDSRNGLVAQAARWEGGVIPYEIAGRFTQKELNLISDAMDQYHMHTCLRFKPRISSDTDYISIVSGNTGCWSSVGRIGGKQDVNLQTPGCVLKVGTAIHELMHALGFMHEQNRAERDEHVIIAWKNILKGRDNNFKKAGKGQTNGFGVPYDYGSVMHYSDHAFSANKQKTILPRESDINVQMGQRDGFSKGDIKKLRKMYNCQDRDSIDNEPNKNNNGNGGTNILSLLFGRK